MIVFYDMIADKKLSNKKIQQIVMELFIRGRKLNISPVFITQSYLLYQKCYTKYCTHYLFVQIPNKQELQQIVFSHSSDIDFKELINLYKKCSKKRFSFLVNDTTLVSDNP